MNIAVGKQKYLAQAGDYILRAAEGKAILNDFFLISVTSGERGARVV